MTGTRALIMLVSMAVLMFVFLPMLAITGLGDLNASHGETPTPTIAPSNASATASPPAAAGGGQAITETSTKVAFAKTKYSVPAGPVTITYDNKDTGTPHNFHLFVGTNANGKSAGKTNIAPGPNTQTLKVTLKAGTYYFRCDVHPSLMTGTITVT